MKKFQKIIKYAAIAFGLYLALTIIGAIVGGVLAICTGIYGATVITEHITEEVADSNIEGIKYSEGFSKLDLEIAASNLYIKAEGEEFKIETSKISKSTKIENKNGTLKVEDTKKIKFQQDSMIIIYVPVGTVLEDIELEIGAGNVNISNLTASNAKIECGAGQVIIDEANLTNADIDAGVGKLVYSGYMNSNSKVNCGIGEVEINLYGGEDRYTFDVEKGIGEIEINDNKMPNETIYGSGENKISIDGGIGSIKVKI